MNNKAIYLKKPHKNDGTYSLPQEMSTLILINTPNNEKEIDLMEEILIDHFEDSFHKSVWDALHQVNLDIILCDINLEDSEVVEKNIGCIYGMYFNKNQVKKYIDSDEKGVYSLSESYFDGDSEEAMLMYHQIREDNSFRNKEVYMIEEIIIDEKYEKYIKNFINDSIREYFQRTYNIKIGMVTSIQFNSDTKNHYKYFNKHLAISNYKIYYSICKSIRGIK